MNSRAHLCLPDVDSFFFFFLYTHFLLLGLGPETYVAFFLINTHFLMICVLAGISLFFFLNCMT